MNEIYDGVEWCPYCEAETKYSVDEDTWIVKCEYCGRPLLLCDKCYTIHGSDTPCGGCVHCEMAEKQRKMWEEEQIGKKVYWNDPDDDMCSGWCEVASVNDCTWTLKKDDGGIVEAFDSEIDF